MAPKTPSILAAAATGWVLLQIVKRRRWLDLRDKVVVVTGGSRGLGLVLARTFASKGAWIALCARDAAELERAGQDLLSYTDHLLVHRCDITRQPEVAQFIRRVEREWGGIDVLVNNAGVIQDGPIQEMTVSDFEASMQTHFWGSLYAIMAVLPGMRARKGGRIVNISSMGGKRSVPHLIPYCASKFALAGLSEGLRTELLKDGIYVTTVCPGLMRTGSPKNAMFKGQHRKEYALFAILDSLPLLSVSAEYAARRIVKACQRGQAECLIGPMVVMSARLAQFFPGVTTEVLGLINRLLPGPGGAGTSLVKGRHSSSPLAPSILTYLTETAAAANNEN